MGSHKMQKSQLKKRETKKSRGCEKQQPHRHLDIHTMQKSGVDDDDELMLNVFRCRLTY